MATTDAIPVPKKNTAYRHIFAIRDISGDLVTSWAGQDSELSLDNGTFADATNEAIEIGTSGIGYIDLIASEMNYDSVILKITVTNTDAIDYVAVLYPEEAGDIRTNSTQIEGSDPSDLINSACDTAISDAALATATAVAALNNLSQADVRTALGMAAANLDTQIDGLSTFDAATDEVSANIKKVNDIAINGSGTEADPWGPA